MVVYKFAPFCQSRRLLDEYDESSDGYRYWNQEYRCWNAECDEWNDQYPASNEHGRNFLDEVPNNLSKSTLLANIDVDENMQEHMNNFTISDSTPSTLTSRPNNIKLVGIDPYFSLALRRDLSILTKNVEVFPDRDTCLTFIRSCASKSVFLVWLDIWDDSLDSFLSNLPQIVFVYVLNQSFASHEFFMKDQLAEKDHYNYQKISLERVKEEYDPYKLHGRKKSGIVRHFEEREIMLEEVKKDMLLWRDNQTSWSFLRTADLDHEQQFTRNISTDYAWYRILTDVVLRMPSSTGAVSEDLLYLCRLYYKTNKTEYDRIREFQDSYSSATAIWWYTRESFLFRLLNRALRTGDIDLIFKFRFIIQDIHRQLKTIQNKSKLALPTLYRGHLITPDELDRLRKSVGQIISLNGFTSATRNRDLAAVFSGRGESRPQFESLLYEISIPDVDKSECVYADISGVSYMYSEDEILFSFNSTFRVLAIEEQRDFTVVKLIVANDASDLEKLVESSVEPRHSVKQHEGNIANTTNEITLADRLSDQGDYERALFYYTTSRDSYLSEDDLAMLHNNSAFLFERRGDYVAALREYQEALKIQQKLMDKNLLREAIIYSNIGLIYYELDNPKLATNNLENSLKLKRQIVNPSIEPASVAKTLNNLGMIDHKTGNYDDALIKYENALEELVNSLLRTDLLKATVLSNIAHVELEQNKFGKAIKKFEEVLTIRGGILPATHPDIAWSHLQIGLVCERCGNNFLAQESYDVAYKIQNDSMSPNHPDLATTLTCQGSIKNYDGLTMEATQLFLKALEIYKPLLPYKKPEVATVYNNLGIVYKQQNKSAEAQSAFETALQLFLECRQPNHPALRKIYANLASLQHSQQDYIRALESYKTALQIGELTLRYDDPELLTYKRLINIVQLNIEHPPRPPQVNDILPDNSTYLCMIRRSIIPIYAVILTIIVAYLLR